MKKTIAAAAAAVLAALALTGCMPQPIEFEAAPETMPAVEPQDLPTPGVGVASWDTTNIEYSGASVDLEKLAHDTAQAIHNYGSANPDSTVAKLSLIKSEASGPTEVRFTVSNDLSGSQLKQTAKATACAIVEEMPKKDSSGAPWLQYVTLISTAGSDVYTFSDTQLCEWP